MIDRKLFQKTFSTLHASPDTLSEVYKVVHKEQKHRHPFSKGMLVAAALAMCITVAAAAGIANLIKANVTPADSVTAADLHAFGADSISSDTPVIRDNSGQVLNLPRMERVAVDAYTISLKTFLIDENGSGFMTYTLSNPAGVSYDDFGYGQVGIPMNPILYIGEVGGHAMDSSIYLDTDASTNTELHLVMYFSDFGNWQKGDELLFSVNNGSDAERRVISITPQAYLPATTFTAESGDTVTVSALGIRMRNPAAVADAVTEVVLDELVLHMADGSQYVVQSEEGNIMNWVVGLCIADEDYHSIGNAFSFNRVVDVDAVTSVTAGGHYYTDLTAETAVTFDSTYTR